MKTCQYRQRKSLQPTTQQHHRLHCSEQHFDLANFVYVYIKADAYIENLHVYFEKTCKLVGIRQLSGAFTWV